MTMRQEISESGFIVGVWDPSGTAERVGDGAVDPYDYVSKAGPSRAAGKYGNAVGEAVADWLTGNANPVGANNARLVMDKNMSYARDQARRAKKLKAETKYIEAHPVAAGTKQYVDDAKKATGTWWEGRSKGQKRAVKL